ncbi:hypothetical protein [Nocardia sp. NPDC051463]|uniref:hypothetical protein n=1 Tax=Nocardia sp. NPDC051463 TaxID=3154845 RepID=UPI003442ABCF
MVSRSIRVPVALAAGLTVAFGPVTGVALADRPSVSEAVFDRSLNLQGVQNARDAGGYRTGDGHLVRTGWCTAPASSTTRHRPISPN